MMNRDFTVESMLITSFVALLLVFSFTACGSAYSEDVAELHEEVKHCVSKYPEQGSGEVELCLDGVNKSSTMDVSLEDVYYLAFECDYPDGSIELERCLMQFDNRLSENKLVGTIESDQYREGLFLENVSATPRDCLRVPWTDYTVNITCNFDVRALAIIYTLVEPVYVHCQTWNELAREESWSTYEVSREKEPIEIHVVSNPGAFILPDHDPHDLIPDEVPPNLEDRYIPLECILSPLPADEYVFNGVDFVTAPGKVKWIASASCVPDAVELEREVRSCEPAYTNIRAALDVEWIPATMDDIGAE